MYGHVVVITSKELFHLNKARLEDPDSELGKVTFQLALIKEDPEGKSIVVVDRLRLATMTFVDQTNDPWCSA